MKKLITMLNSYPGVNINEHDFVFSKPTYIPHLKMDMVKVQSKLNSSGYLEREFLYKRYNLDAIDIENDYVVNVADEQTVHALLYRMAKTVFFPYQEGDPWNVQDKYVVFEKSDVKDAPLPTIPDDGIDIYIEAKPDSYYFRGRVKVTLKKIPYNHRITKIEFIPNLMIK